MIVVVGVDGSDGSLVALRRARRLAAWLEGELHVVYVTHHSPTVLAALEGAPVDVGEIEDKQRRHVWDIVGRTGERLERETHVDLAGYPPDAIVDYASKLDADLIVVGHRGLGGLASALLGSTSRRILHSASCDVLIVKGEWS